jgi:PAS domain S-box-containing protein
MLSSKSSSLFCTVLIFFSFLCLVLPVAATPTSPVHPQRQQTEVLFLSSSDPDLPDVAALIEETETQILEGRNTPIHFTLEYFDPSLLDANPSGNRKLASLLREKRQGQTFDLVITIGERTAVLAERDRTKFFPNAPLLFCLVNPDDATKWAPPKSGTTGVIRKLNYLPTLQLALGQNPGTRQVIVIAGSSEVEKREMKVAREQFHSYESNVAFRYWTDLKLEELRLRLANLEPDSVVVLLDFQTDIDGEQFVPSRILPSIAPTANRPIYGSFASFVGNGIVGGSVADLREVGRILGQDGVRILNGERPENIPVETAEFQRNVFDWRQLHRWQIRDDQLPPGSSVLYWEYSPWEIYRWRILALSAAVVVEALLIFLLLHLRSKRKRAEEALSRKEAELSEAQRLAEIGSWKWNPKSDALTGSDALYNLTGLDHNQSPSFKQLSQFLTPESWERLTQSMEESRRTGERFELELRARGANSAGLWVIVRGEAIRDGTGSVIELHGTMQNITERKQAEEDRLRHSAVVESSDDAIISKNLDGIVTSWNSGAERIFKYSEAEAVGQPITIIIPPELRDEESMMLRRVRAGERIEHYETVRVSKEGATIRVSLTISPVRDSTGRVVGASKIARDITKHKRAEEELKKSEEKFSTAFRHAPLSVTLTNAQTHRYIDVNETFERLTGYSREELIGRSALDVGVWADPSERVKLTKTILAEGRLQDVEFQFRMKDGRIRVAQASAEVIEIEGEQCVLSAAIDITDRKHAEQALLESEKRFRLMADATPVLIWLSGPDKLCTDFNKEWLRFTGRTMQQELGEGWAQNVHPDDLQDCLHSYTRAFDARQNFTLEYRLRRHDGMYRWVLDRGAPRFLEDGGFAGYIGCCIDITDQKEAKTAQAELGGRLIQAQEDERARIARELHDDINQRLALLANGLQQLGQPSAESDDDEHNEQPQELLRLTNDIATDIQHLSHQLHPSKLHYLGLAAAVRDLCQEFSRLQKIEVECVAQDLPRNLDDATSLSLFRIVQESLRNVAKHSNARHVKVELLGQPTKVRLRVSDDGIGFDPEHSGNGQGLGLVSMRERLRLVSGELSIWSRPSLGTQVEGIIPVGATQARSA